MPKTPNLENEQPVHPDQEIIDFFLACARDAREGRVLFVVASVGYVKPPQAALGPLDPAAPPANRFAVNVGAFVASRTATVEPVSLASACDDVCRGAAHAADQLLTACTKDLPKDPAS